MTPFLIHRSSGPVQAQEICPVDRSPLAGPASGCKGLAQLRFSTPCPLCALVCRFAFRSPPAIRVAPARFRIRGKGHAPAPRLASLATLAIPPCVPFRVAYASVFGPSRKGRSLFVFPRSYGHPENQERTRGRVRITCELSPATAVQRESAVRCGRRRVRSSFGARLSLDRNVKVSPGPLSLTAAQLLPLLCDPTFLNRIAPTCLKQPRVLSVRALGTVDFVRFPPLCMATQPTTTPAQEAPEENRAPVKVLRIDDVSASIFKRNARGRDYFSVSLSRSYKDLSGVWRYTKSFDFEDLGKIVSLCQQADEYIRGELNEQAV